MLQEETFLFFLIEIIVIQLLQEAEVYARLGHDPTARRQHVYPVVDGNGSLRGSLSWDDLHEAPCLGSGGGVDRPPRHAGGGLG